MADDTLGTGSEQTTPSDADDAQTVDTATTQTQASADTPDTKTDANAIAAAARKDEAAKRRAAEKELAAAQARLAEFEAAAKAAKDAELSEIERAQRAAAEAAAAKDAAEARALAAELGRTRADLIAADPEAATLPPFYKAAITGTDAETLAESLAAVKEQYAADAAAIIAGAQGKPPSLGTQSNVTGGAPPPGATEWSPENNTVDAWRKEREKLGIGVVRI